MGAKLFSFHSWKMTCHLYIYIFLKTNNMSSVFYKIKKRKNWPRYVGLPRLFLTSSWIFLLVISCFSQICHLMLSFYWILSFNIEFFMNWFFMFFLSYNKIKKLISPSSVYNLSCGFIGLTRMNVTCFFSFFNWFFSLKPTQLTILRYINCHII